MKYGYARISTDGQSVDAQVRQLTKAGCKKVFREVASGAKADRALDERLEIHHLRADARLDPGQHGRPRQFRTLIEPAHLRHIADQ